jgi:hypothetical protein
MQLNTAVRHLFIMKQIILFLVFICNYPNIIAQTHLEVFTGYQHDINNRKYNFDMINSGVQISWKKNRTYEMLLQLQMGWGIKKNFSEAAYTSSPDFPVQSNAKKIISPAAISFSIGHRFVTTGKNFPGSISVLLYTGLAYQKIKVFYQYDKINYTILNPDRTQEDIGVSFTIGAEYMKQFKNGRGFFQVLTGPQPLLKKIPSNISFNFMAPLSFNAGYSFIIKKQKKHDKKK